MSHCNVNMFQFLPSAFPQLLELRLNVTWWSKVSCASATGVTIWKWRTLPSGRGLSRNGSHVCSHCSHPLQGPNTVRGPTLLRVLGCSSYLTTYSVAPCCLFCLSGLLYWMAESTLIPNAQECPWVERSYCLTNSPFTHPSVEKRSPLILKMPLKVIYPSAILHWVPTSDTGLDGTYRPFFMRNFQKFL